MDTLFTVQTSTLSAEEDPRLDGWRRLAVSMLLDMVQEAAFRGDQHSRQWLRSEESQLWRSLAGDVGTAAYQAAGDDLAWNNAVNRTRRRWPAPAEPRAEDEAVSDPRRRRHPTPVAEASASPGDVSTSLPGLRAYHRQD